MKIYFAGSIRGGREDVKTYAEIISFLSKYGDVLTEHVADLNLVEKGEKNLSDQFTHGRDIDWLTQSDVIVAEVTTPSLGVGYEIRVAVELKKKILCLYRPQPGKRLSAMISGSEKVTIGNYQHIDEAIKIIEEFFKSL